MLKKLQVLLGLVIIFNTPLAAQNAHIELSYQSFRPFIHFQLEVNNYRRNYNPYESAYIQGYMDGVNNEQYFGPHFIDMVRNVRAYRSGYRDGFRDCKLLIRLRGRRWYTRHRFAYDDYYARTYAVQIWLEGLSLAFLKAPEYRLPHGWRRRAHPHLKHYRQWMRRRSHRKNYNTYYSSANVERRYKKRIRGYQHKLNKAQKRRRRNVSHDRRRVNRKRFGQKHGHRSSHNSGINRSRNHNHNNRVVKGRKSRNRRVISNRGRGAVHKKRNRHSAKSKRQRNRRGRRGHGNNH